MADVYYTVPSDFLDSLRIPRSNLDALAEVNKQFAQGEVRAIEHLRGQLPSIEESLALFGIGLGQPSRRTAPKKAPAEPVAKFRYDQSLGFSWDGDV
ncbi:MAG: hypothetical protein F4Z18_08310 [Caldilineaceae bacterium SB0666_bin_21]|nr:hypothetical protein [Caldilineaceae bacterium SB0666_bin_21]